MALNDVLTPKQAKVLNAYLTKPFKIMILNGAVRSGKTYIDNFLFIYELRRVSRLAKKLDDKHPQFILAGTTSGAIYNNVVSELSRQFGLDLKPDKHNHYHLFGVDIVPVYTASIAGLAGARGFTSYGAYINEATLANQEVFKEIQNRCSMAGSHIICDTNPDIPTHWLKQDFIDNKNPKAGIISFTFTIDENTFLDKSYVEALKASTPAGMFYDRAIKGLWVTADGLVYRDFNADTMLVDEKDIPAGLNLYAGVDWGYEHYNSIVLLGDDPNTGITYVLKEITGKHKLISHWVKVCQDLQKEYGMSLPFYVDSARPDNLNEFLAGGMHTINANKAVLPGIECIASLMKQGKFKINRQGYDHILNDIYKYVWDERTGEPDKKIYDADSLDALRYGIYSKHAKGGYVPWT